MAKLEPHKLTAEQLYMFDYQLYTPNSPLYRCRLFETEDAAYLFFDVHHIIYDGTSSKVFTNSVINAYMGAPLENDYYYLALQRREQIQLTDFYNESCKYFEDKYESVKWTVCPKVDTETRENKLGELSCAAEVMPAELSLLEKKYMLTRNEFYIAVTLLAIAISTNAHDVRVSWVYNGRDDLVSSSSVGLFFRDLPVALRLNAEMTLRDIFAEVHEQVQNGIKYSCYPYNEIEAPPVDDDDTCILYQRDLRDVGDFGGLDVEQIDIRQNKAASQTVLDIQILDGEDGLQYVFDYAASRYKKETMSEFQNLFKSVVAAIVNNTNTEGYTFSQITKDVRGKKGLLQKIYQYAYKKRKFLNKALMKVGE